MSTQNESNHKVSTLITLILLVFVLPVGIIFMWLWSSWRTTVKWVVTVLAILGFLPWIAFAGMMVAAIMAAFR